MSPYLKSKSVKMLACLSQWMPSTWFLASNTPLLSACSFLFGGCCRFHQKRGIFSPRNACIIVSSQAFSSSTHWSSDNRHWPWRGHILIGLRWFGFKPSNLICMTKLVSNGLDSKLGNGLPSLDTCLSVSTWNGSWAADAWQYAAQPWRERKYQATSLCLGLHPRWLSRGMLEICSNVLVGMRNLFSSHWHVFHVLRTQFSAMMEKHNVHLRLQDKRYM